VNRHFRCHTVGAAADGASTVCSMPVVVLAAIGAYNVTTFLQPAVCRINGSGGTPAKVNVRATNTGVQNVDVYSLALQRVRRRIT